MNFSSHSERKKIISDGVPTLVTGSISFTCPTTALINELISEVRSLRALIEQNNVSGSDILDNADLIRTYKVSRTTATTWRNEGLAFIKKGNKLFYKRADVESFLSRNKRRGF